MVLVEKYAHPWELINGLKTIPSPRQIFLKADSSIFYLALRRSWGLHRNAFIIDPLWIKLFKSKKPSKVLRSFNFRATGIFICFCVFLVFKHVVTIIWMGWEWPQGCMHLISTEIRSLKLTKIISGPELLSFNQLGHKKRSSNQKVAPNELNGIKLYLNL